MRIDHPDGLFDPARYFEMLQQLAARAWDLERAPSAGPDQRPGRPLYVVAEKILSGAEPLPTRWAVHGTTGYNFLNDLNGLFVNTRARAPHAPRLREADRPQRGVRRCGVHGQAVDHGTAMASELTVLAHMLDRIGESNRRSRDFTLDSLRDVITEVVACFPVYRTYVDEHGWRPRIAPSIERAVARARRRNPGDGGLAVRFLPRGHAAERPDRGPERARQTTNAGTAIRRPMPTKRGSGCASR